MRTHSIEAFLESDQVEMAGSITDIKAYVCLLHQFKRAYKAFCDANNKEKISMNKDAFLEIFQRHGLKIEKMQVAVDGEKDGVQQHVVMGCKLVDSSILNGTARSNVPT